LTDTIDRVRIPFHIPAPSSGPVDVVGLGLNSVDLVAVVAEYPASNSKQPLQRFARLAGGETATAVAVCARLGWRAAYVGSFGSDDLGELSRRSLTSEGVDISGSRTVAGATNQFAVVLVDARSGERTVLWDRDAALTMRPADVSRQIITSGRLLLVDYHETFAAAQAASYAREAGMATVIDIERTRPGVAELLHYIDAIIAAQGFPEELTGYGSPGRALAAMAHEFAAPLVCVTLGHEGSLALCGGHEIRTPAFPVESVDTTGAGDAFRGGFAAGCLRAVSAGIDGAEIEDVLLYANAVAALNCRALGARGGMPTVEEVETLLKAQGRS
jgi:sulfofructose kinase